MQIVTPNLRFFYFLFTFSIRNSNSTVKIALYNELDRVGSFRASPSTLVHSWFACYGVVAHSKNPVFAQRRHRRATVQNNIKMSNKCMQMMTFSLCSPISKHFECTHTHFHEQQWFRWEIASKFVSKTLSFPPASPLRLHFYLLIE